MRLFCWNVNSLVGSLGGEPRCSYSRSVCMSQLSPLNMQVPTVRNINLKYGSLAAFFAHLDVDVVCLQVCADHPVLSEGVCTHVQRQCCSLLLNVPCMQRLDQCVEAVRNKLANTIIHHATCSFMLLLVLPLAGRRSSFQRAN